MKKTILFFSEAVTVAHVIRLYKLACSLDAEVYDVHFAVADRYSYVFNSHHTISFHSINSVESMEFIRRAQYAEPMYKIDELINYVKEDEKTIRKVQPDLIIGDMRQSLCVSTRTTKTTYIAMTNAYWSKYINNKQFIIPELRQINMNEIPFISAIIPIYFYFFFKNQGKVLNELRRYYKLPIFEHCLDGWNFGDHLVYSDPKILFDTSHSPSNHHFLGSINWEPDVPLPIWWQELSDTKKTAYVALGSSGDKSLIPLIVEKLLSENFQVIISGVNESERSFIFDDASVFSSELIPGSLAAARSDLVISNGGSPTSYQSLLAGTPVIGIPTNLDQLMSMKFIERNNAGKILRPREVGTTKHTKVLKEIQKIKYKERAEEISAELATISPEENFAKVLKSVLN